LWKISFMDETRTLDVAHGTQLVDISGRVSRKLVAAAKQKAGVRSDQELLHIALTLLAGHD
jgi:hypothetical protein